MKDRLDWLKGVFLVLRYDIRDYLYYYKIQYYLL